MSDLLPSDDSLTTRLAELADAVGQEDLAAHDRDLMRLLLLDSLGCAIFGGTRAPLRTVVEALTVDDHGEHPVWGTPATTCARTSALLTAALVHSFEYDDQCLGAGLHAGAATVPSALALAPVRRPNGTDLLRALRTGSEVGIAVGRLLGSGPGKRGFHIHCWTGALASTATAATLLRLGPAQIADAFGLAGTVVGGFISAQYGTETKRLQAGRAAEAGLLAATLAAAGTRGIERIIERPDGGLATSIAGLDSDELAAGVDPAQRLVGQVLAFKSVPCKIGIQSPYAALDAVLTTETLAAEEVERVGVVAPEHLLHRVGHQYCPGDEQAAQANLRWILARRVLAGPVGVQSFGPRALDDPTTTQFANSRIDLRPSPAGNRHQNMDAWTAIVSVTTRKGETIFGPDSGATPWFPGHREVAGIRQKFLGQAATAIRRDRAERLYEAVWSLDTASDAWAAIRRALYDQAPDE